MPNTNMPAVILAGGATSAEIRAATGADKRALIPLGERTMLDYVVSALRASESIGQIFVVGDVPKDDAYTVLPEGAGMIDNLFTGLRAAAALSGGARVLVSTSDIPFLTAQAIDDFVRQSAARGAAFCYPVVSMDVYNRRYASMKRTTLKLREGVFTGGNIVVLDASLFLRRRETITEAYAARKSVLKLGAMLGPLLLSKIIVSQTIWPGALSLAELEGGVMRLIDPASPAAAVVTDYAEIGTDVDKPEDIAAARAILAV